MDYFIKNFIDLSFIYYKIDITLLQEITKIS